MNIGEQIKKRRKEMNMTQEHLAEKCGLSSKRVIYDYESGRINPSILILHRLASALNCKLNISLEKNNK